MDNEGIIARLLEIQRVKTRSVRSFAQAIGVNYTTIDNQLRGKRKVSMDTIMAVVSTYDDISTDWIMYGQGQQPKPKSWIGRQVDKIENAIDECTSARTPEGMLPLVPVDALAGYVSVDNMGVSLSECDMYRVPEFTEKGAELLIRVSGDSMYPTYHNGDKLACRVINDTSFMQWGRVYVLDTEQGALVKRLYQGEDEEIVCHSDNEGKYRDFRIPKEAIRKMFIILGVIRME